MQEGLRLIFLSLIFSKVVSRFSRITSELGSTPQSFLRTNDNKSPVYPLLKDRQSHPSTIMAVMQKTSLIVYLGKLLKGMCKSILANGSWYYNDDAEIETLASLI